MSFPCRWLLGLLEFHFLCYKNLQSNCSLPGFHFSWDPQLPKLSLIQGSREVNYPAFHLSFCPAETQSCPRVTEGILSTLSSSLSYPWIIIWHPPVCRNPCFVYWVWLKAPQAFLNYRGHTTFHGAHQLDYFLSYLWDSEKGVPSGFVAGVFVTSHSALAETKALNSTLPLCSASQTSGIIFSSQTF